MIRLDEPDGNLTGIPSEHASALEQLLDEARRLHAAGTLAPLIISEILQQNRRLPRPLPAFSPGGVVDSLATVLGGSV